MFDVIPRRWETKQALAARYGNAPVLKMAERELMLAAVGVVTRPPDPGEMAEAARRVVHVQRLFRPVFPKPLPRQFFAPCSGA